MISPSFSYRLGPKGRCHGNQFWYKFAKLAYPTFIRLSGRQDALEDCNVDGRVYSSDYPVCISYKSFELLSSSSDIHDECVQQVLGLI